MSILFKWFVDLSAAQVIKTFTRNNTTFLVVMISKSHLSIFCLLKSTICTYKLRSVFFVLKVNIENSCVLNWSTLEVAPLESLSRTLLIIIGTEEYSLILLLLIVEVFLP
jgi:hypothetical protein